MKTTIFIILCLYIVFHHLNEIRNTRLKKEYISELEDNRELQLINIDLSNEIIDLQIERIVKLETELDVCLDIIVESYYREAIWDPELEIYSSSWVRRTNDKNR